MKSGTGRWLQKGGEPLLISAALGWGGTGYSLPVLALLLLSLPLSSLEPPPVLFPFPLPPAGAPGKTRFPKNETGLTRTLTR